MSREAWSEDCDRVLWGAFEYTLSCGNRAVLEHVPYFCSYPAVKGTFRIRIGLWLRFVYPISLTTKYIIDPYIHYHIAYIARTYASTPSWKHAPSEGNCGNVCLIRNCSIPIGVHNVLFSKQIKIYEFDSIVYLLQQGIVIHSLTFTHQSNLA